MKVITPSKNRGNGHISAPESTTVQISPPNIKTACFSIQGTSPLVIHRFDVKVMREFGEKIESGTKPKGKRKFEPRKKEEIYEAAKYIGETNGQRWEGFNASSVRCALISACRLVNFKMTLAKLSLFVLEDGRDIYYPAFPLVRIIGDPTMNESIGRTETGVAMLIIRPMYFPWAANLRIRFDADQFSLQDVSNLLNRAGAQVGIGEGRNDSPNSNGLGWGSFEISNTRLV